MSFTKMQYYNKISKGYNELYLEEQLTKINIIKNNINTKKLQSNFLCPRNAEHSYEINKTDKILDVGCGTGILKFNNFFVGIDPSIELLKINKNNNKINGTAEYLPFKNDSFDIVISITAIHNFNDIKEGLKEINRVGKNKFVLSVLKNSKNFNFIKKMINENFEINKTINEKKDIIFFSSKKYL